MPKLNTLQIATFRNLRQARLGFSQRFNVFYGDNGAGKTSLLEAVYYLGMGKSFRNTTANHIIQHQQADFVLLGNIQYQQSDNTAAICCHNNRSRQIKLNGDNLNSIAAITRIMPIQFMSPMSYRFFHDGPKTRRQYLDWALFHVEHQFLALWRSFQQVLKQRNSALKQQQSTAPWDIGFTETASKIDNLRESIVERLKSLFLMQLKRLLPDHSFEIVYQRGWPENANLAELLSGNQYRDRQLGYTWYGPQRADVQLTLQDKPIQHVLSQGQQKLAAYALHLSLGSLLQDALKISPIYLVDDLPSELDANSRSKIIDSLNELNAQTFITGIARADLSAIDKQSETAMFHVERGEVNPAQSL